MDSLKLHPERDKRGRPLELTDKKLDEVLTDKKKVKRWRKRLRSLPWRMKDLAEWVARKSNREDETTGRFWQGRYGAIRIEDAAALLACAVYVDLHPIRAGMASLPLEAKYTSVCDRIRALQQAQSGEQGSAADGWLNPLETRPGLTPQEALLPSRTAIPSPRFFCADSLHFHADTAPQSRVTA